LQAFTEGLIEGHIATDIIITISGWAGPSRTRGGSGRLDDPLIRMVGASTD